MARGLREYQPLKAGVVAVGMIGIHLQVRGKGLGTLLYAHLFVAIIGAVGLAERDEVR